MDPTTIGFPRSSQTKLLRGRSDLYGDIERRVGCSQGSINLNPIRCLSRTTRMITTEGQIGVRATAAARATLFTSTATAATPGDSLRPPPGTSSLKVDTSSREVHACTVPTQSEVVLQRPIICPPQHVVSPQKAMGLSCSPMAPSISRSMTWREEETGTSRSLRTKTMHRNISK